MYGQELQMETHGILNEKIENKNVTNPEDKENVAKFASEDIDFGNDAQKAIFGNLLRVSIALLHSD